MYALASFAGGPLFTNDAIVLGVLLVLLALIFYTETLQTAFWKKFYTYVPSLLLCYFLPALFHWPLHLIAPHWYDGSLVELITQYNLTIPDGLNYEGINKFLEDSGIEKSVYAEYQRHSQLYFVASRYLLPASLILLCLGIDFKGIVNLGPKALIMFGAATVGIILGGPIALFAVSAIAPGVVDATPGELWRGLSTIAGSWIGGGANQAAMKEIFEVKDNLFGTMIVIDVIVANIWMGFLLYGAKISHKLDDKLKADNSAIQGLIDSISDYRASIKEMPTTTKLFVMLAVAFGGVAISHFGADLLAPFFDGINENSKEFDANGEVTFNGVLLEYGLSTLMSGFFWLVVICTTIGLALSFTTFRKLEGVGASRWGSIFIYVLVATIGMKMDLGEVFKNLGLFSIGIIWMLVHIIILLATAKLIKAPFFFVAVGSQANIGGAASAPIVASAFNPSLAPVGVLMAVLGYAMGTYGAWACALMMQAVSGG